jgi:hypothetical protein
MNGEHFLSIRAGTGNDLQNIFRIAAVLQLRKVYQSSSSSSYSTIGFYNPLAGLSFLILEVSKSHTMTQHIL